MNTSSGIALLGLNGSGKSTLAHAISQQLNFYEMDIEDYYFPEQKESRLKALEGDSSEKTLLPDILPFSSSLTKSDVESLLLKDILMHPHFVLAGVTMNWREEILSRVRIAFLIKTPLEIRLQRIQDREIMRFGSRVLPGGDMYDQQCEFRRIVAEKDSEIVYLSAERLSCPVIKLDGTRSVEDNLQLIKRFITMEEKN